MKTRLPSRAHLVVDALVALLTPDPEHPGDELAGLQVIDGPVLNESNLANDALLIAPGTPDEPGLVANMVPTTSLGRQTYLERCEVTMVLSCYSGDTAMSPLRARAAAILGAIKTRAESQQSNGDAWERIYFGSQGAWFPVQTDTGAVVTVGFTLVTEATI